MPVIQKVTPGKLSKSKPTFIIMAIFVLFISLSFIQDSSPKPVSDTAPLTEFSAERAMEHVREIAKVPHPTGSKENESVINYIVSQMTATGIDPVIQDDTGAFLDGRFANANHLRAAKVNNIVGKLPGTNSTQAIMLTAHHDSVPNGPGANDDAVGVATLLETLRALKAGPPLQNDVVFVITDAEEVGLLGARAYWDSKDSPYRNEIGMVVNFEARGTKGPSMMFQTSKDNGFLISQFAQAAQNPVSSSLMGDVYAMLPNDTDMTVSNAAKISGINFAFGDGWNGYHTERDNIDHVSMSTLQHHGVNALQVAKQFGNQDLSETKEPDRVYFNLFGMMVHYPKSYVILLSSVVALLFLYAFVAGIRKKILTLKQILIGLMGIIAALILSIGLNYGLWFVVDWLWGNKLSVSNGATFYNNWFELSFLFLTFGICYMLWGWLRNKISLLNFWFSGQFIWVLLLMGISIFLPGGSYLFMWPSFIQLIILIIVLHSRVPERLLKNPITLLVIAAAPILLWTMIVRMLFVFMPIATNVYIMAIPVLLFAILYPLIDVLRESYKRIWPRLAFAMTVVMLVGTLVLLVTDDERQSDSNLFYMVDTDKQEAKWVSMTPPNDWSSQYVNGSEESSYMPLIYKVGDNGRVVRTSKAPVIKIEKPVIQVLESTMVGDTKTIHLQVKSSREARRMLVSIPNAVIEQVKLNGKPYTMDSTRSGFVLLYTGMTPEGIELEITTKHSGSLQIIGSDVKEDLSTIEGLNFKQRPDELIPSRDFDLTTFATTTIQVD